MSSTTPSVNTSSLSPRTVDELVLCSICCSKQPIKLNCGRCVRDITYLCQPPLKCWGLALTRCRIPPRNDYCRTCRALFSLDKKSGKEVPEDLGELVKIYELTEEEYVCPIPIPEVEKEPFQIVAISQEPSIVLIAGLRPIPKSGQLDEPLRNPPSPNPSEGANSEDSFEANRPPSRGSATSSGVYSIEYRRRPPPPTVYDRLRLQLQEKLEDEEMQKRMAARRAPPEFDREKMARVVDQAVTQFKRIQDSKRH